MARTDRLGGRFFDAFLLSLDNFRERGAGEVQSVPLADSTPAVNSAALFWTEDECEDTGEITEEVEDRGRIPAPVGKGGGSSNRFSFL